MIRLGDVDHAEWLAPSRQGPAENFTGSVRVDPLFPGKRSGAPSGSLVTFQSGVRTAWHTHPLGHILIVTAGIGRVQRWDFAANQRTGFCRVEARHAKKGEPLRLPALVQRPSLEAQPKRELTETPLVVVAAEGYRVETALQPDDLQRLTNRARSVSHVKNRFVYVHIVMVEDVRTLRLGTQGRSARSL